MAEKNSNQRKDKGSLGRSTWPFWPVSCFLPADRREEYIGDLIEIGNDLIRKGYPSFLISSCMLIQLMVIVVFFWAGNLLFVSHRQEEKEVEN